MKKKWNIVLILCMALFLTGCAQKTGTYVVAEKQEEEKAGTVLGKPLIQTTFPKDEFWGLLHLGLLQTEVLDGTDVVSTIEAVKPCVVMIDDGEYYGSGIILSITDKAAYIVSNKHLLCYGEHPQITFFNGELVNGTVLGCSEDYDIGVVEVSIFEMSYEKWMELCYANTDLEAFSKLENGDLMFLVGSSDGVAEDVYQGTIKHTREYFDEFGSDMIYNACAGKQGMSGGGTFDAFGHCIGMTTGGLGEESASLPLDIVLQEFNKIIN